MLNSITTNGKTISRIYKGSDMIWEMPYIMYSNLNVSRGSNNIIFITYPSNVQVSVTIYKNDNTEEKYTNASSTNGSVSFLLKTKLEIDDYVAINLKKFGWKDTDITYIVY